MYYPSCERARERLMGQRVTPRSKHLPRGSTPYFPRDGIIKVLTDFPVEQIFTCNCERCRHHADLQGRVDSRPKEVDKDELLGPYATMYGLLIYLRFPSLISIFLRHQISLDKGILFEDNLKCLDQCKALTPAQADIIRGEVLEYQYRFSIQTVLTFRKNPTTIDEKEIFPIEEDEEPVGKGDFGEVYAFDLPDEYIHASLKSRQIKRFARKIFDQRWTQASTAREWLNHIHANDLQHPHLMEALAAFEHGIYFFIVYELAQCTLWNFLKGDSDVIFTPEELWSQVQGMASGLAYLHGQSAVRGIRKDERMYHLDLKPSNILIVNRVMKIADFGLSDYKLDPRPTESALEGDSRREGVKVYAPPSGGVTDKYDVYSLGTITSEIACFDIGPLNEVACYRENRKRDGKNGQDEGSEGPMHFFYSGTWELKQSVIREHARLLEIAEESRKTASESNLTLWQQQFYNSGFFEFIERMLHVSARERPAAAETATMLESCIAQATRATRASSIPKIDVWDAVTQGSVMLVAKTSEDEPPEDIANRLRAYLGDTRCGIWLFPNLNDDEVKLKQFVCEPHIQEKVENVYRKRRRQGVKPLYVKAIDNCYPVSLVRANNERDLTYRFPSLREALRFQSIMTGENVHADMSIKLTQFGFYKKERDLLYPFKKTYKLTEQKLVMASNHLQFWASRKMRADRRDSTLPEAKLAILTGSHLFLMPLTSQTKPSSEVMRDDQSANMIRLVNVEVLSIGIASGIPLMFRVSQRYRNNEETRFESTRYDEVRLIVETREEITKFWEEFDALRRTLPGLITRSATQPLSIV